MPYRRSEAGVEQNSWSVDTFAAYSVLATGSSSLPMLRMARWVAADETVRKSCAMIAAQPALTSIGADLRPAPPAMFME